MTLKGRFFKVKDSVFTSKLCVSQEKYNLLTALHGRSFFSALHQGIIQVLGNSIYRDNLQIDQITCEEHIELLWSEYLHAEGIVTTNDLGLRVKLEDQEIRRQGGAHE